MSTTKQTYGYLYTNGEVSIMIGDKLLSTLRNEAAASFLNEIIMVRNALHFDETPGAISAICYLWMCASSPNNEITRADVKVIPHVKLPN